MSERAIATKRGDTGWWGLLGRFIGAQTRTKTREGLLGWAYISPWILGLILFVGGPIIASFILSFTEYDVLSPAKFVGLDNYKHAFFEDPLFWGSLGRTLYFSLGYVPIALIGSLWLAILLNQKLHGTNVFRTLFFLPHLTPSAAMAVLWLWLMNPHLGPINYAMKSIGLPGDFPWLTNSKTVIPSLQLISLWSGVGGNNMLIFLAGLQGVNEELYEAAEIDGAGQAAKFWNITVPMISPAIFFNLILGIIGALQVFTLAYVATAGGPSYGSWFYALHVYEHSFSYFRMGYGSALAWIFVALVMSLTLVNVKMSRNWVYYEGE